MQTASKPATGEGSSYGPEAPQNNSPCWASLPQVYNARLRLSRSKPTGEQLAIVDDVVDMLQLRHVQHQVVGTAERRGIRCATLPWLGHA
jgi:hypothetical protein